MDRAERAKETHDCRTWVEAELGQPFSARQQYAKWKCPFHEDKEPSFTVWRDGYYCFGCGNRGSVIDWIMARRGIDLGEAIQFLLSEEPTMSANLRVRAKQHREIASKKEEQARKLLAEAQWHRQYADALDSHAEAVEYLEQRGVPKAVAMYFEVGYRDAPWGPCISIPWAVGDQVRGIQYRIMGGEGGNRYRWDERAHGNPTIYNADAVSESKKPLWIVEGALKALVLITHGLESVALVNKSGWKAGWAGKFRHRPVFVCLDPDAREEGQAAVVDIGGNAKLVDLPRKPDDLIVVWGWTAQALEDFARVGVVL